MQGLRDISETGVNFTDSLTACETCAIDNSTQQSIHKKAGNTKITERLQLVSTDVLGPVTSAERGNFSYMVKYSNYYTKY